MNSGSTKRFLLLLAVRGNPDLQQDPFKPPYGCPDDQFVRVASIEEAQVTVRAYIDRWNVGGGQWVGGDVLDAETNTHVGMVYYNGRWGEGDNPRRAPHVVISGVPTYDEPMFMTGVPANVFERTIEVPYEQFVRIVADLLTRPDTVGELDEQATHDRFVSELSRVVADHCGGMVLSVGSGKITVAPTDSLPGDGMGVWEHGADDSEASPQIARSPAP